jgi:hypothetical protein
LIGPGRYLLGVIELLLLLVPAWAGAARVRSRLLPRFEGAPAQLATSVLVLALLIVAGEVLGTFGLFEPLPYIVLVALVGGGVWFAVGDPRAAEAPGRDAAGWLTAVALLVAAVAVVHFGGGVKTRLGTGMTGFDSTWYHGPFAAGFFQSGDTWHLHFIAPQFLAWFYPANSELVGAVGMLAFGRDILSPLLNLGWFVGCLLACWCIGRPYRVAPWSLGLGAVALSVPALADQAGEARNDLVGVFFLLAAVAVVLNAWRDSRLGPSHRSSAAFSPEEEEIAALAGWRPGISTGALVVVGLAAGLAAGTKLNFLLPAAVLVLGLVFLAGPGRRWHALAAAGLPALAGGGYWYLRNLVHSGNPLPWIHHLGPISLPSPGQTLGGREAHSVLGYLTDGHVWSAWFLPAFHHAFWILWPLLSLAALVGLALAWGRGADVVSYRAESGPSTPASAGGAGASAGVTGAHASTAGARRAGSRAGGALALAGLVGLAVAVAWLVAPTSASGPSGSPRGFESGLRYLAPALILGLALLPAALPERARVWLSFLRDGRRKDNHSAPAGTAVAEPHGAPSLGRPWAVMMVLVLAVVVAVVGYPVARHYLASRYKDPSFTTPGLNAAFAWARGISDSRIGTTSTRQYPLFGTDLSNRVSYIGETTSHGGFEAPRSCSQFIELVNEGDYDYVVASRDRIEPGQPPFPPSAGWLAAAGAEPVLRKPPTVVFHLPGQLDPSTCAH